MGRTRNHRLVLAALAAGLFLWSNAGRTWAEDNQAVLKRARAAAERGDFAEAERILRPHVTDPDGPVIDDYAVALEILRRIRLDYALTPQQMLTELRSRLPDATAEDMERWRKEGTLQHRVIDGQVHYFNRAAGNLLRALPELETRHREQVAPAGETFDLPRHAAMLLELARTAGRPDIHPVRHHVRYTLNVKAGHPRLRKGAHVRCWLPFPQEYRQQRDVRLTATSPPHAVVAPRSAPQRTVYFEQVIEDPSKPPTFTAEFEFTTCAYVPTLDPGLVRPYETAGELYREYTAERPPHIVFTPDVRRLVAQIVGEETNALEKARRIFRWISANIPWCAEMEYSTIPNISAKALETRKGDCGVQGLLFITLCRAAGIPARWQSGWETLPNRWNMHDWSEFYVEPWGWLPADASYGVQQHDDPRVQEFFCGHMDPYRMIVNLDYARALHPAKTSFRSEPNDFQRGEIEVDGHNLYFDKWSWSFDVRTLPQDGGLHSVEEALDAIIPRALKDGGLAGAVIAVGHRTPAGYTTWEKAYGFSRIEPRRRPMRCDAIFDLASMTKPIATGTSLMILVEQGRVGLDDPVGKYLPEFNEGDKRTVTVRHLMTHMSGMPPYVGAAGQKTIKDAAGFPCPEATRAHVRKLELIRPPGERLVYSCLNAILCAEIVETVSGKPLDAFATENIFAPLGMNDTGFNPSPSVRARCVPSTRADYGQGEGGFLQGQVHDPLAAMQAGVSGNAGLFSTVENLHRFAQMMLNGGVLNEVRILKKQSVEDMTRVQNPGARNAGGDPDRRGLLWDLYVPDPDDRGVDALFAYGHTGYTGTAIRLYPQQGYYVIALANRVHPDDTGKIAAFRRNVWETVGKLLAAQR